MNGGVRSGNIEQYANKLVLCKGASSILKKKTLSSF